MRLLVGGHPGLFGTLERLTGEHRSRPVIEGVAATSYGEVMALSQAACEALAPMRGRRIAVHMEPSARWITTMAALDRLGASAFLLSTDLVAPQVSRLTEQFHLDGIVREAGFEEFRKHAGSDEVHDPCSLVTLLTSGTTGEPKAVQHRWESLMGPVRVDARFVGSRWLLAYPLHLYAGLQVFLQCFLNAGTLVLLPRQLDPNETCRFLLDRSVQYVSATPSFWRRLLSFGSSEALRRLRPRQITLGGEPATEDLLRSLRETFPEARIVHIYATSELGRCFSVTDARAGFPVDYLERSPEPGTFLRIVDGELQVRSASHMLRYDPRSGLRARMDDWFPTGDLAEIVGDRVHFRGRRTDMINVGGNKVYPLEVESVVRQVEGVADVRVYPVRSSLTGELVAADVVPRPGHPVEDVRRAVAAHCARRLQSHQRPRQITMLSQLDLTSAGKVSRREP